MPFHFHFRFSHHIEVEALVRVKIQNHTIGLFHITGERTPAVKFYSAHLDASGDAVSIRDIKVRLLFPIFFPDLNMANMFPETSGIMLLEKAFPCPALGAAHETARPVCRSEERRGGKECVSTCRCRGSPAHYKKNKLDHKYKQKI